MTTNTHPTPPGALPPNTTRVLATVIRLHALHGRVTIREVCAATGLRSTSSVFHQLAKLRREGLIEQEPGTRGTLRPAVTVVAR